jgi:hypothetical protein
VDQERRRILQGLHRTKEEKVFRAYDLTSSKANSWKQESTIDDKILATAGKDGRKKALERSKQYEKDIQELEKKKVGLENMLAVHQNKVFLSNEPLFQVSEN